jgi:hypothetical protein
MATLFDEIDPEFAKEQKKANALVFKKKSAKNELSKEQKKFNKYVKQIEKLTKQNAELNKNAESYLNMYYSEVYPEKVQINRKNYELGKLLFAKSQLLKLTNSKKHELKMILMFFFDRYSETVEHLSEDDKKVFSDWSGEDYDTFEKDGKMEMLDDMEEELYDMFGINVDMHELYESSDSEADFAFKVKELMEEESKKVHQKKEKRSKKAKKSPKEIQKEKELKEELELKEASIKSIYKTLVMAVHPDKETDETLKIEKDALMKEVTAAYKNKDLKRLLQIEIEVLNKETDHIEQLSEQKLAAYNSLLKEQVDELELENQMIQMNPRFAPIYDFLEYPESVVKQQIKYNVDLVKETQENFNVIYNKITSSNAKSVLNQAIKSILDLLPDDLLYEDDDDDEDEDDFYIDEEMLDELERYFRKKY